MDRFKTWDTLYYCVEASAVCKNIYKNMSWLDLIHIISTVTIYNFPTQNLYSNMTAKQNLQCEKPHVQIICIFSLRDTKMLNYFTSFKDYVFK